jgi:hypothetical protein
MAGQGWNGDGLAGSHPNDAPNVVRFPGNWIGPLEDLVPIGTDAATEPDAQHPYADDPDAVGAAAFWGGDAQAVHRLGTPAPVSPPGRRRRRSRLLVPIGGFAAAVAVAVAAVTVALGSGTQVSEPGLGSQGSKSRSTAELAAAPRVKTSRRSTGAAGRGASAKERSRGVTTVRRAERHRAPTSVEALPRTDKAVTKVAGIEVPANASTGDVASPTGAVSPPPNATQLNP